MIVSANTLRDRQVETADVVVVGSGCGGAVVAAECARAGRRVVVLEEGRHVPREEYSGYSPSEAVRRLYRDYGATPILGSGDTPMIMLLVGRAVGGSSLVNGAVCGRPPDWVMARWANELGLKDYGPEPMGRAFDAVEREMGVAETPEALINPATKRFRDAATRLGYPGHRIRRNVQDCDGCCRCVFTCPHDHKKSVVVTHLDGARAQGAVVIADCRAEKLLVEGGRAIGVAGRSADGRVRVTVAAGRVVLAGGAVHTPLFLKRNGLHRRSPQVGRNLTVHPSVRTYAEFDEPVYGWKGAFQSYAFDEFRAEGVRLVNVMIPKGVFAGSLARRGRELQEIVERYDHIGLFGGMISDVSTGQVDVAYGWRPLIRYRLAPEDRAKLHRALDLLCTVWFEAGARRVFLPFHIAEAAEATSMDQARRILASNVPMSFLECTAQHPLGTCRMGVDPRASVVGPDGAFHGLSGLYVVDGSIVPSSVAVNPQVVIMALAKLIGQRLAA